MEQFEDQLLNSNSRITCRIVNSQVGVDRVLNILIVELEISQLGVYRVLNVGLRVPQKNS